MVKKLDFIWEKFISEPRKLGCRGTAMEQTLEFIMQIAFEEKLMENGFEPEEAVAVYIADAELRMPPEAPQASQELLDSTIFLE